MVAALGDLEKFIHTGTDIPCLVRAAMVQYQFEAIHPFVGGNGRVGRLLMALLYAEWQMLSQPMLNLSVYFERYRQEYFDHLLEFSQRGDWETWLCFFLCTVSAQAGDSVVRMDCLAAIRARYQPIVEAEKNADRMGQWWISCLDGQYLSQGSWQWALICLSKQRDIKLGNLCRLVLCKK